jgi:phytoene dehydrogenase-like protein
LTARALLARAGKSVLVVEADERPGGQCARVALRGYTFDRADHLTTSCEPDGPFGQGVIDAVLRELGVRERCEFVRVDDPFYVARYPDFELSVPCGHEPYLEARLRHFPSRDGDFAGSPS